MFFEKSFLPLEKKLHFEDYDNHWEIDDNEDDYANRDDDNVLYQFNPDLLQWVLDHRRTTNYNKLFATIIEEACSCGNLDILMWMRENKPDVMDNVVEGRINRITESAALGGAPSCGGVAGSSVRRSA